MKMMLVEDEKITRITLGDALAKKGHEVVSCSNGRDALSQLDETVAVVLSDLRMPGMDGLELLRRIKERQPATEVVLMTAYSTVANAVEALKLGAYDYLTKPFDTSEMLLILDRLEAHRSLVSENIRLRDRIRRLGVGRLVGTSAPMRKLADAIDAVAAGDFTVLICGESGTGKELVAEAIHERSVRSEGPFVKVSCAALSETVLESELYGHERGAFTGADRLHRGRFERSAGGTLFLDDIDDFPLPLQVKLLRTLQEKEIERVGSSSTIKVDLRVVAATKVDLRDLVAKGLFREDLYYRLNIVPVEIPPLRDRGQDLPLLVGHFLAKHAPQRPGLDVSPAAMRRLSAWPWPGNVRELENCMQRMVALTRGDLLDERDLPPEYLEESPTSAGYALPPADVPSIDFESVISDTERGLLQWALDREHGNQSRAAACLGLARTTLCSKLKKYGLDDQG
ncbi:sigma-54-dependent Fis family transcriptional regulator [bacterium]|nr:sigma-54-dependent Fis family transcriptional regulator [bacterium]